MGKKQRRLITEAIGGLPENAPRVILATGFYIGEGFDEARLDTPFLAMPISWKGTLQQYVGRLHRLHDAKRVVKVYDYVDSNVLMLARMYARRLKGYNAIGYRICSTASEESVTEHKVPAWTGSMKRYSKIVHDMTVASNRISCENSRRPSRLHQMRSEERTTRLRAVPVSPTQARGWIELGGSSGHRV